MVLFACIFQIAVGLMQKTTQAIMVQGTTSDAGKSVLVAGLCRVLARKGIAVAPFKSQNMALNSAESGDGADYGLFCQTASTISNGGY